MVLLGGLEIIAAGYLINEHKKKKLEKQRIEDEEEEYRRRRAERHERRKAGRSSSAPPAQYGSPSKSSKYGYSSSPPPSKDHPALRPGPSGQYFTTHGPPQPPPMQYAPRPAPIAMANPSNPLAYPHNTNLPSYNNPQFAPPPQAQPSYPPPHDSYELSGDTYHPYSTNEFANHSEGRVGSPPDFATASQPTRRPRSSSRVRFALPVPGDESHVEVVRPGTPPPPYVP